MVHLFFAVVDHFEPFNGHVSYKSAVERVNAWRKDYPQVAARHRDIDGRFPQHTWFYPPHLDHCFLTDLVDLCGHGFGEIELHLHHNHMEPFPDTSATLKGKILKAKEDYGRLGIFCLPDGSTTFGFVHGDWSLDNALGKDICGINNEIQILQECGCYADFTFPTASAAQPSMTNRIFYAKDDPDRSKSYNRGVQVARGGEPWGDLLIIQGITGIRWKSRTKFFRPSIELSNLGGTDLPKAERIDYWIKNSLCVRGQPNWRFVKLHTHGAIEESHECFLGDWAHRMFDHLECNYNDGTKFALHYVTAREMYNLIKAAERGLDIDPNSARNFEIPRYIYLEKERGNNDVWY